MLLSTQYSLLYTYLYIVNAFKYLFLLSENKESYHYYYKNELIRLSVVSVFSNMLYSKKRKPGTAGNQ